MHDPMVVAFSIRRPWPERSKFAASGRPFWKMTFKSPFWMIAGREWYWPCLITIWHVDPSGYDSGVVCKWSSKWQWHIHHWKFQFHPLQRLRRALLTRCTECGGKSTKKNPVNCSSSWDTPESPWWKGEIGLYHDACLNAVISKKA